MQTEELKERNYKKLIIEPPKYIRYNLGAII